MPNPVLAIIAQAVAKALRKRHIMVKHRFRDVHMFTRVTPVRGIHQVGDDAGQHHLAEPFVARAGVTGALRT